MIARSRTPVAVAVLCASIALVAAGCADVVVFGRKVHDVNPAAKAETASASASASAPAPRDVGSRSRARAGAVGRVQVEGGVAGVDEAALLEALNATLRARSLLATESGAPSASITVVEVEAQPTSNAVVMGSRPGAGRLLGRVRLLDRAGTEIAGFDVEASAVLRAPAAQPSSFALRPLYQDFATRVADRLADSR